MRHTLLGYLKGTSTSARRLAGALGAALVVLAGGCAAPMPAAEREARSRQAYVYYLDGAGGGGAVRNYSGGVRAGLRDAGYPGYGEMFSWETGLGVMADQTASVEYKRGKAGELAKKMDAFVQAHPGTPVYLIGLSAGTAIAAFALEALPPGVVVENVVLLSGSLSADYDLTRALQRVRSKCYVFTSPNDVVLANLMPVAGTADRRQGEGIGTAGCRMPPRPSAETRAQYGKIVHVAWRPEFEQYGDRGGHTDTVKGPFVAKYVAPLLMGSAVRPARPPAAPAGMVANPDYQRWEAFGVGSYVIAEGTQVVTGVRRPLRIRAELAARTPEHLLVTRSYDSVPGEEPPIPRQFFVPAWIRPEQHPSTHPRSRVAHGEKAPADVAGRKLDCELVTIDAPGEFPDWGAQLKARLRACPTLPGGLAQLELRGVANGQPFEVSSHVVEWKAVPRAGTAR